MAHITLDDITRDVEGTRVLDRVSFEVSDGEFVMLIGSSGSGKTSILRVIAGLDPIDSGAVRFDGLDVALTPTNERDVGMVTQHNTLFPTHRVRTNLLFPLRHRKMARAEAQKRVEAESRANNIDHILERWPSTLSGGEQQLTQIARALVRVPKVFLMDEPLSQLDVRVRNRLRQEIVDLQRGYRVTTIYASNRPEEIMTMPDRVVCLDHGKVVQSGTPTKVKSRPASLAIAELTGTISRLAVHLETDVEGYWLTGSGVRMRAWTPALGDHVGRRLTLAARSEDVRISPTGPITAIAGTLTFLGAEPAQALHCGAGVLYIDQTDLAPDSDVTVVLDKWLLFDEEGQLVVSFPS